MKYFKTATFIAEIAPNPRPESKFVQYEDFAESSDNKKKLWNNKATDYFEFNSLRYDFILLGTFSTTAFYGWAKEKYNTARKQ